MRPIKFRAWDKEDKKIIYPNNRPIRVKEDGKIGVVRLRKWEDMADFWKHISNSPRVFEIQQFTGLTDKNGKEIFEGDILRCGEMKDTIELGWATGEATDNGYGFIWSASKNLVAKVDDISGRFEVIGNVWENPELLK